MSPRKNTGTLMLRTRKQYSADWPHTFLQYLDLSESLTWSVLNTGAGRFSVKPIFIRSFDILSVKWCTLGNDAEIELVRKKI